MTIKARLARLEARAPGKHRVFAWVDDNETLDEAFARQFPDGEPPDAVVIMVGWTRMD